MHIDEIALLNTKKLDEKKVWVLFLIIPESPEKSLSYVQIEASKSNCLLSNVYIHCSLFLDKKKKNANSDFLTTLHIFHGTVEL